jgi:hypothetical protein
MRFYPEHETIWGYKKRLEFFVKANSKPIWKRARFDFRCRVWKWKHDEPAAC